MSVADRSIDPRIIESAKEEFLQKGFLDASLQEICKNAGVTTGALYKRFKGKEELFCALVESTVQDLEEVVRQKSVLPATLTDEQLKKAWDMDREYMQWWFDYLYDRYDEMRLLLDMEHDFPGGEYPDVDYIVAKLRVEGSFLDVEEVVTLRRALAAIGGIVSFIISREERYPALHARTRGVAAFPEIVQRIDGILDRFGQVKDNASPALQEIRRALFRGISISNAFVNACCEDAWRRLIEPSAEREIRGELTDAADEAAIRAFGQNLQPLLMQPPLRNRVTMGFDPAYRTGCKIAVVDETGKVLETGVVYPTPPHNRKDEARETLTAMIRRHGVTAIAIGNGTASKESEIFIADMIRDLPGVAYMVVNEAGASVYSASKLGAEEFPDYDVSLRSAVSIARRLQDPLAELVKIEPKSIGVGQYQHDMPPARLDETLRGVVEDCVNSVGADLNTASAPLLSYVAGLNDTAAKNIVAYREANGAYPSRAALKKVPRIGPKAFEQCAGFLRVTQGKNVLDATGVHPESYAAAEKLLALCGYTEADVRAHRVGELRERVKALGEEKAAAHCGVGVPTLSDIVSDLMKPGRDPRDELPAPLLRTDILELKDLKPGMKLRGTVRNVVDFGAFVDIGVHQDGLVHISRLSDNFVRKPSDVVRVGDVVDVAVVEVDAAKKRIALSMLAADVGRN